MKVAIINPFGNSSGHSLNYASKLCFNLAKQEVNLTLFTSSDFDPTKIIAEPINFKVIRTPVKNSTLFNKNYKKLYSLAVYGFNLIYGNLKVLKRFSQINKIENFDVVHIIGGETTISILYFFFTRRLKSQLILTVHNSDFTVNLYRNVSNLKHYYKQFIRYLFQKHYFKRFSKIMVHGEQMKFDLIDQITFADEKRIYPVNIGLDIHNSTNTFQENIFKKPTILFFGVIRQDKGLQILLNAIKRIDSENFILKIYGKPAELKKEEIISLVNETGKSECIELDLRYFDDNEISTVFNSCNFVILPYLKTFKAQSVVLTLAAAHKRTIICSDTGQNGYDVNKYNLGYSFKAEDTEDLTKILNDITSTRLPIITDPSTFDNYIYENNWEKMGEKIYKMYLD